MGRYITVDPFSVGEHVQSAFISRRSGGSFGQPPLELNPYVYVADNPLRWSDPTGEASILACGNPANAAACIEAGIIAAPKPMPRPVPILPIPNTASNEDYEACAEQCSDDKAANDALCYIAKASGGKKAQALCLKRSFEIYTDCLTTCRKQCK